MPGKGQDFSINLAKPVAWTKKISPLDIDTCLAGPLRTGKLCGNIIYWEDGSGEVWSPKSKSEKRESYTVYEDLLSQRKYITNMETVPFPIIESE